MANKLYTEEQIRKAIELAQECEHDCGGVYFKYDNPDEVLEELTPIELPSDESIEKKANKYVENKWEYAQEECKETFTDCAKWLKDKILNENFNDND